MKLIYNTYSAVPNKDDTTPYAKFYRKHNFREIFDSYMCWGPSSMELHCHSTPAGKKLIVDSMYYTHYKRSVLDKKEEAPRSHLELLCEVFNLPIKPLKNGK